MPDVITRGAGGALVALLLLVLGSGPAAAHASLVGSDPADGDTLATAPTTVTLTFNENIGNPAYVVVEAPDGTEVDVTDVRAVDRTVTATVEDVDKRGEYAASYRVVSADGHPISGTVSYTVEAGAAVEQVEQEDASSEPFLHRHGTHLWWGLAAAVVAVGLLLAPLRRRRDPDRA